MANASRLNITANSNPASNSRIFAGSVTHRRHVDKAHSFGYKIFMLYLDLDEISSLSKMFWFMGFEKTRPVSFWRRDYLPQIPAKNLKDAVIQLIFEKTGTAFIGKVFILTHPRWFGFIVNPLTMYYCFDPADKLTHMIGEITNTPWKERHTYVLSPQNYDENIHTFRFKKAFHVSPFLPMEMDYTWKMSNPAGRISVDIWNHVEGRLDFEAHLALSEEPLTSVHLLTHWLKDPWITLKTLFGIYWHAGLLYFVKKVHFYSHPKLKNVS